MRTLLEIINTDDEPNTIQDLIDKDMTGTRIYISGKITGIPYPESYANFERAENEVNAMPSCTAVNPMKLEHIHDNKWESFMAEDLKELLKCHAIYLLTNWGTSRGARCEYALAKELGLLIMFEKPL